MTCYHKLAAFQGKPGTPLFFGKIPPRGWKKIWVPCKRCIGCLLDRSNEWGIRCMHEAHLYQHNSFLTLTYDEDHLPKNLSLNKAHYDEFLAKLRERLRYKNKHHHIRHFMCGEYGDTSGRPHYHTIIFNYEPTDKKHYKTTDHGQLFTSRTLNEIWGMGATITGNVTHQSSAYVARYCTKRDYEAGEYRQILDVTTGEIIQRLNEYGQMSNRPGIGAGWYNKHAGYIQNHDRILKNQQHYKVPKYYDTLTERSNPTRLIEIKLKREDLADTKYQRLLQIADNTDYEARNDPERPQTHERVKLASIHSLKGKL